MRNATVRDSERREDRQERLQAVVIHACLAMLVLLAFEGEKLVASGGALSIKAILGPIGSTPGGAIVAMACALLVVGRSRLVGTGSWLALCSGAYGLLLLVWAIDTRYFLATGLSLDWGLIRYTVQNASVIKGIVQEGWDTGLLLSISLVILTMALAWAWSRRANLRFSAQPPLIEIGLLGFSLLVFMGSSPGMGAAMASGGERSLIDFLEAGKREFGFGPYEAPAVVAAKEEKPNVVVVVLESFRADALGVDDHALSGAKTPALDELAAGGHRVETAYTAVTHTSKALVGILCGAFPRLQLEIGEAEEGGLPLTCLPEILGEQGYRTRFIQSADGAFENRPGLVANMGFDEWLTRDDLEGVEAGYLGMDDRAMLAPISKWLEEEDDRPFLFTILTSVSHHPFQLPGEEQPPNTLEAYLKSVTHVDGFVGEAVSLIRERAPDTLFVLVGDHGQAFGEHGRIGHNGVPFEEGVRVPLILSGPWTNLSAPVIGGLRHQVDILPTVLEGVGLEWRGQLPGFSLSHEAGHPFVVSSCWFRQLCTMIRFGDLKLIDHYNRAPMELYDLVHDPREFEDLALRRSGAILLAAKARIREIEENIEEAYSE